MKLDTDRIPIVAHSIFRRSCRHFSEREIVQADQVRGDLQISLRSVTHSAIETVHMKLRIRANCDEMLIGDLRVAPALRLQGRGRELVEAAEAIAHVLGIHRIHLFPLWPSRPFWHSMGYRPQTGSSQVMEKNISVVYELVSSLVEVVNELRLHEHLSHGHRPG